MIINASVTILLAAGVFCCDDYFHHKKYTSHPNWRLLPSDTCGVRANFSDDLSPRVFGGRDAELGQYPWIAEVIIRENRGHSCGGAIINEKYVLSAAHCFASDPKMGPVTLFDLTRWSIILGEHTRNTFVDCTADGRRCAPPAVEVEIENVFVHPRYCHYGDMGYDIALVRLKRPIHQYNEYIRPICLPTIPKTDNLVEDQLLDAAGWGMIMADRVDVMSNTLQTIRLPFVSQGKCDALIYQAYRNMSPCDCDKEKVYNSPCTITKDTQICAGRMKRQGVGRGDSGGPLMTSVDDPQRGRVMFLVGITSHSPLFPVRGLGTPDVYTKVSEFILWILNNIQE